MQASTFLNILKDEAMQNIAANNYTDAIFVFNINTALTFISRFLNARNIWTYSAFDEVITPETAPSTVFNTTYTIEGILRDAYYDTNWNQVWEVYLQWFTRSTFESNWSEGNTGVIANPDANNNGNQLERKNFFVDKESDQYSLITTSAGVTWLKTGKSWNKLYVRYKRWLTRVNQADLAAEIDLPEDLLWVLFNLSMWKLMPYKLENWFNLAQAYFQQAIDELTNYASGIGEDIQNTKFSA